MSCPCKSRWPILHLPIALLATVLLTTVLLAKGATAMGAAPAQPVQYYVATDGSDSWSGRRAAANADRTDGPFATLIRARDAIRQVRRKSPAFAGAIVEVGPGTYVLQTPFELTREDSGTGQAPIEYRAAAGGPVRLLGGQFVHDWKRVESPEILERLDPSARDQVRSADLKAHGITQFGSPAGGGVELFFEGRAMTLSRWPNEGFAQITGVLGETERVIHGRKGRAEGIFTYDGDRPSRWIGEPEAWVHGYWFWDWSEQRHKIHSIDTERRVIEVEPPYHTYGYLKGQWFYAFNLLSEIDRPGEWFVDRQKGTLFFWPPSPVDQGESVVSVSASLVSMNDVSHVRLHGFALEGSRGTAVTISGGTNTQIVGCTIRNVGGWGVTVSGGTGHGVVGCDMHQMGQGGISLTGGDRKTLTPAGHHAENNHIHHYARVKRVYQPGITLQGVGNRAAHNLIHNGPHMGIGFGGNDHLIELNEIHSVCYESNDAGAIYTGRNWTMRGTVIRNNYLHDIRGFRNRGCVGVYLDDMFCGTRISGNLFYRVTRAAFIGGGRDCVVTNNLFVDCAPSLHIDARALGWAHDHSDAWVKEGRAHETLSGIPFKRPPYSQRYPELVDILDQEPAAPRGNRVFQNISFGGKWDGVTKEARPYLTIEKNLVDRDPKFLRPERIGAGKHPGAIDFALREDSPAWALGFEALPLEKMGLTQDAERASWPVTHAVR